MNSQSQHNGSHEQNRGVSTGNIWLESSGVTLESFSPVDGKLIGKVSAASRADYDHVITTAQEGGVGVHVGDVPGSGVRRGGE
jgi:hypothetical protein